MPRRILSTLKLLTSMVVVMAGVSLLRYAFLAEHLHLR